MTLCFGGKFELSERIGSGSFGEIFLTKNVNTDEVLATKLEKIKKKDTKSQLRREAKIYQLLHGSAGIPSVKWFGETADQNILVMDLLGQSLEDLFNYCNRQFSLKTVLLLAYELVSRIETVHSQGKLIHRDIKPENFLMGRGKDRHTVYIIDFGLAKHYCNPRTGSHVPGKEGNSLTGTARYASLNAHRGHEQSRRDDLFSIGYVLMYFLRGSLPWQGLKTRAQLLAEAQDKQPANSAALNQADGNIDSAVEKLCLDSPCLDSSNIQSGVTAEKPSKAQADKRGGNNNNGNNNKQIEREDQEKYRLIMEKKAATPIEELCAGFPDEFQKYFEHLETLSFEDTPDYAYLKSLFKDLFRRRRYAYDHVLYDWEVLAHQRQQGQQQGQGLQSTSAQVPVQQGQTQGQGGQKQAPAQTQQHQGNQARGPEHARAQSQHQGQHQGHASRGSPVPAPVSAQGGRGQGATPRQLVTFPPHGQQQSQGQQADPYRRLR